MRSSIDGGILYEWERALHANFYSNSTGFCVAASAQKYSECCKSVSSANPLGNLSDPLQCFHLTDSGQPLCLSLQESISNAKTCFSNSDCLFNQHCVTPFIPHSHLSVLRIHQTSNTVVFVGDAREVWQDVRVGCIIPRFALFPPLLPYFLERLMQYASLLILVLLLPFLWHYRCLTWCLPGTWTDTISWLQL